jgi:hypothetical protein
VAAGSTPQILMGLADAQEQLAAAQDLFATVTEEMNAEVASYTSSLNTYRTELIQATNSALYYGSELSGNHIDPATAQAGLTAARAAAAAAQASIASLTTAHQATMAGYAAQVQGASANAVRFAHQVTANLAAITVVISPQSGLVQEGTTLNLTATVGSDPNDAGVIWTLDGVGIALDSLSNVTPTSCTYNAPASVNGPPAGPYTPVTIWARSVTNPSVLAQLTINLWGTYSRYGG